MMEKENGDASVGLVLNTRSLKRILLPFWICRSLLLVVMGVSYLTAIYWISQNVDIRGEVFAATIVLILLTVFCISLDVVSMILIARNALKPLAFLVLQIAETAIWTIVLVLELVTAFRTSQAREFLSWFVSILLYLSFIGLLLYASIIYDRTRRSTKRDYKSDRPPSYDGLYNNSSQTLAPANPFDDAYAHSRNESLISQSSRLSQPFADMPVSGRGSFESFATVTLPENAELKRNPDLLRYA